ncbi:MAG: hypothetical protein ACYSUI_13490, partial [Planctomycetota bacterium]
LGMRRSGCGCEHHGPCTKATRACYDDIDPRDLMGHLHEAMAGRYGIWDVRTGKPIVPPVVEIVVNGVPEVERKAAVEAACGLEANFVEKQTGKGTYVLHLQPGKVLRSSVLWSGIAQQERYRNVKVRPPMTGQMGVHVVTSP